MKFSGSMPGLLFFAARVSAVLAAAGEPDPSPAIAQASTARPRGTRWDAPAAAAYLDGRMDLWFEKARKLRTGEGTTTCVSCHMTVPYALARPVLRKAAGVGQPTAQEAKVLDDALRRVETYGSHDPMSQSKAEQSCGTEAVLNLLILAGEDARGDRRVSSGPTRKALEELWKEQRADGAWNWLDTGLEPYESTDSVYYGAALAAMGVGTAGGYAGDGDQNGSAGLAKLRSYVKANYAAQNLHSRTWMLLASTRLAGLLSQDQADEVVAGLQREQNADGGWSLYKLGSWTWSKASAPYEPEGKPDVSLLCKSDAYATGLIAYALRQAGWPAQHPSLRRATAWLEANQHEWLIGQSHWNCWRTYSLNYDHEHGGEDGEPWRRMFMSDAATAFAALALLPAD